MVGGDGGEVVGRWWGDGRVDGGMGGHAHEVWVQYGGVPPCPSPCPRGSRGMYAPAGLGEGLHLHESMFLLTKVSAAAPTPGPPSPRVPMHGGGCEVAGNGGEMVE